MKLENCQFPNRKTITGKGSLPYPVGSTPAACKTRQDKTPRGQIKMAKCKVKARPRRGAHPPIFTLLLYKCPSRLQAPCSCEEAEVLPAIVYDYTIRMAGLNSYYGMIQRTFQRVYVKVSRLVYDRGGSPLRLSLLASLPPCLGSSFNCFQRSESKLVSLCVCRIVIPTPKVVCIP